MDDCREFDEAALKRSYMILKLFFTAEDMDEKLKGRVRAWLVSDTNTREKDMALMMVFNDMMDMA